MKKNPKSKKLWSFFSLLAEWAGRIPFIYLMQIFELSNKLKGE